MVEKLLKLLTGWNGTKTLSEAKRDTKRNMAFIYQLVKRNTPGVMKEWSILGTVEQGHSQEEIDSLSQKLRSGEIFSIKAGESSSFTDRIQLHQVETRDNKLYMHAFRDTKYSNGADDYLFTVDIPNKFSVDHLPADARVLKARS